MGCNQFNSAGSYILALYDAPESCEEEFSETKPLHKSPLTEQNKQSQKIVGIALNIIKTLQ